MKGSVRTSNKEEFSHYFSSKINIYLHTDFENGDAIFRSSSDGGKGGGDNLFGNKSTRRLLF